MNILNETVKGLEIGQAQSIRNLTVITLKASAAAKPHYLLLSEALASGVAELSEVSDHGSVPEIQLINRSDASILLLDGEELVGCKQNRIVNLTILAPPHQTLTVPVSCVEQGRWHKTSDGFSPSPQTLYAGLRARKVADVSASMAASGERRADQSAIWDDIGRKSRRVGSHSASDAMHGMFERRRHEVADYVQQLRWTPRQIGAVFAINGRCLGFELFDCEKTCQHYLPKIAAGYALDALESEQGGPAPPNSEMAQMLLEQTLSAKCSPFPAIGLGQDLRLVGSGISGAGLEVDNEIVHLCVFDARAHSDRDDPAAGPSSYGTGASIRRRVRR